MEEVRYYISDDGKFRADNPEEVIKYEEETEKQLKEELQKLSEFYAAEEVGYIAIVNHGIGITYFGPSKPSILEEAWRDGYEAGFEEGEENGKINFDY